MVDATTPNPTVLPDDDPGVQFSLFTTSLRPPPDDVNKMVRLLHPPPNRGKDSVYYSTVGCWETDWKSVLFSYSHWKTMLFAYFGFTNYFGIGFDLITTLLLRVCTCDHNYALLVFPISD